MRASVYPLYWTYRRYTEAISMLDDVDLQLLEIENEIRSLIQDYKRKNNIDCLYEIPFDPTIDRVLKKARSLDSIDRILNKKSCKEKNRIH